MNEKTFDHEPTFERPTNTLRVLEDRAVNIRKLLNQYEKYVQPESRGIFDDAVKLAVSIEQLCSKGQCLTAADANATLELVEILFEQLDSMSIAFLHQSSARCE